MSVSAVSYRCEINVEASHPAGCAKVEAQEIVDAIGNADPWIIALANVGVGIATCFFGGILIDYLFIAIPALFSFIMIFLLFSNMGFFALVLGAAAAVGAGFVGYKYKTQAVGVLGAIAGFFGGFLLYSFVIAAFITTKPWLLIVVLVASTAFGGYAMYKW